MEAGLLLGRQDGLHRAEPGMAGGFSVKVQEQGEDGGRVEARKQDDRLGPAGGGS